MRGKLSLTLPDQGRQHVKAGEWFILSLQDWSAISSIADEVELALIECSADIWKSLATSADRLTHTQKACFGCALRQEALFLKMTASASLKRLANELSKSKGSTPSERIIVESKTLELLALASEADFLAKSPTAEPCLRDDDGDALELAAAYLEENLSLAHSLSSISRKVSLNEFKLKKGFRERYKTTVFGYLRQKRMERGRELLDSKDTTVLEVANSVGYANPSHFTRAFRETFGLNPREFIAETSL